MTNGPKKPNHLHVIHGGGRRSVEIADPGMGMVPRALSIDDWRTTMRSVGTIGITYQASNPREWAAMKTVIDESLRNARPAGVPGPLAGAIIAYQLNIETGANVQGVMALLMGMIQ